MSDYLSIDFSNLKVDDIEIIKTATKNGLKRNVPTTFFRGIYYFQKSGFSFYEISADTSKGIRTFYMPLAGLTPQSYEEIKHLCERMFDSCESININKLDNPYEIDFHNTFLNDDAQETMRKFADML